MMQKKITIDVFLDEDRLKRLEQIIEGNRLQMDINNEEDLKKLCSACLACGIITEEQKARERIAARAE